MQRDREFQELMEVAQQQGKIHREMQQLQKEVEKRDSDIQQLQKQLKEAEQVLVGDWNNTTLYNTEQKTVMFQLNSFYLFYLTSKAKNRTSSRL